MEARCNDVVGSISPCRLSSEDDVAGLALGVQFQGLKPVLLPLMSSQKIPSGEGDILLPSEAVR